MEFVYDGGQEFVVDFVEAVFVDVESFEGGEGDGTVDGAVAHDLCEVADASEEGVGDAGRASAAEGYLHGGVVGDGGAEEAGGAEEDASEDVVVVVLEVEGYAESGAEGGGEQAGAGGGADEGEGLEGELDGACAGAFVDHDVDAVVLHGGVEVFFDDGREAVDFVDEEDVVFFERCEYSGQVAGFVEDGAGGDFHAHAELVGDDAGEGCLAQARGAEEQDVVEGLAAHACGLDKDAEVGDDFVLAVEILKGEGSQGFFEVAVAFAGVAPDVIFFFFAAHFSESGIMVGCVR